MIIDKCTKSQKITLLADAEKNLASAVTIKRKIFGKLLDISIF